MSICAPCRAAIRQAFRSQIIAKHASSTNSHSTAHTILSKPSWSVRSHLGSADNPSEKISPAQLNHLLRLAALPPPRDKAEEDSMIETLQSQLRFVRAVQRVETTGVEPLRAIRDETEQGTRENTVSLDTLKTLLDEEELVGHYKRSRRVRSKLDSEAENWDALSTASKKAGRFFVVQSNKKNADEGSG
ncbi:unnamed protein product [Clonostachys rhizophaga]|uniref:Glutamyl-tRNA amidotransferase complex subunit Gta3 domain-containing protein n=1 Tax=Clonostachys rhizophaga TaxID=160324 RepID=A0A9N9VGE2_9HYPO|nr:unnamed protein product [Clonostachys rhizophaga]